MKLIEWLLGDTAQHMYADSVYEYPVKAGIKINPAVAAFGTLKADTLPIVKIGQNKKAASTLVDKVGFDN
jgi:iron(III) transport system substrate-binding protein